MNLKKLLTIIDGALSLFSAAASRTPSPKDDAVAAGLRVIFDLVSDLLGGTTTAANIDVKMAQARNHFVGSIAFDEGDKA